MPPLRMKGCRALLRANAPRCYEKKSGPSDPGTRNLKVLLSVPVQSVMCLTPSALVAVHILVAGTGVGSRRVESVFCLPVISFRGLAEV